MRDEPQRHRAHALGRQQPQQIGVVIRRETRKDGGTQTRLAGRVLDVARIGGENDRRILRVLVEPVTAAKPVFFGP